MSSILDVEPLYSAEQIVVPTELPEILKAFTKEVVRNQPENVAEFAANYFANLAHLASEYSGGETALQVSALIALRKQLEVADKQGTGKATRRVIENACSHLGIAEDMMQAVFRIGAFSDNDCNWREFVVLGCALLAEDVLAACKLIFEVFSPTEDYSLPAQDFLDLFHLLTHKDDTVDDGFYQDLRTHLANDETVTFAQFCESGPGQQLVERPLSSGR